VGAEIANWLERLTDNTRKCGFVLCYLYLRNVKAKRWNHKRVYRIYRELELNLRIKPKKHMVREKSVALTVKMVMELQSRTSQYGIGRIHPEAAARHGRIVPTNVGR
jgi:kynureninase